MRDLAHVAIDEGAGLVLGNGPHQLRGIEVYKGRPISEEEAAVFAHVAPPGTRCSVTVERPSTNTRLVQRTVDSSAFLRECIVTHDITRDRELDATLRQVDAELAIWMKTAGHAGPPPGSVFDSTGRRRRRFGAECRFW